MGCAGSKTNVVQQEERPQRKLKRPTWTANPPLTVSDLQKMKDEFWDTQPHYGGATEIWDTLKAVAENRDDDDNSLLILDAAGIKVHRHNLSSVFDERGYKYDLPKFVLTDPTNLLPDPPSQTNTHVNGVNADNHGEVLDSREPSITSRETQK